MLEKCPLSRVKNKKLKEIYCERNKILKAFRRKKPWKFAQLSSCSGISAISDFLVFWGAFPLQEECHFFIRLTILPFYKLANFLNSTYKL